MSYELEERMEGAGFFIHGVAGENLTKHKLIYRETTQTWKLADADALITMPVVGITIDAIMSGKKGRVLVIGLVGDSSWTWTVGDRIYASNTPGELTQTAPTGSGDLIQAVAVAWKENMVLMLPGFVTETVS